MSEVHDQKILSPFCVDIFDNYSENELDTFLSCPESVDRIIEINKSLHRDFDFIELYEQPVEYVGMFQMNPDMVDGPPDKAINQQSIDKEGNPEWITPLKTIEMGESFCGEMEQCISEGRPFTSEDYLYTDGKVIPIIAGSDYSQYLRLGDRLTMFFIDDYFDFEVVGFFRNGQKMLYDDVEKNLDNYICVPFFDILTEKTSELSTHFINFYYLEKNSGYIGVDLKSQTEEETALQIMRYSKRVGFPFCTGFIYQRHCLIG